MFQIVRFLKSVLLLILFGASLNLSVHAAMPDLDKGILDKQTSLSELDFFLLPFREGESNQTLQPTIIDKSPLSYSIFTVNKLYNLSKTETELQFRLNSVIFREYPFIVVVRNLRI